MDERPTGELDSRLSAEQIQSGQAGLAGGTGSKSGSGDESDEQSALKDWIELLVRAGFWALLIYVFIFQISVVDGSSMDPTFHHNDRLVIDKLTYRFTSVRRNDVIVFETIDVNNRPRSPKDYIKRVIGLPGEKVEIYGGSVYIDGKKLEENFGLTFPTGTHDPHMKRTFVVPPNHFFVLGDNREGSKDSRISEVGFGSRQSLGFVPAKHIRGLVRLRFWPWNSWTWFGRGETPQPEK